MITIDLGNVTFSKFPVLRSMLPASILINFWIDKPESKESVQESVQGIRRIRRSKESKGIEPKHPNHIRAGKNFGVQLKRSG